MLDRPRRRAKVEQPPHPVDTHVGEKLRLMRTLRGLSQAELAARIGLTVQQIRKYESGASRTSASRLWEISEALDTPVAFFFDGLRESPALAAPTGLGEVGRGNLNLIRHFERIEDESVRDGIHDLVKRLAKSGR